MKLQKIIFYFPNFSEGGVENTSIRLSNYFTLSKIKIDFISIKPPKKKYFRNLSLINFKSYSNTHTNWFSKNYFCLISLFKVLLVSDKKNTVVFALSNLNLCILFCKLLGFKIVSRNSAPIDYFKYNPKFLEYVNFYIKCFIYPMSDLIIANSKNSAIKLKKNLFFKVKIVSIPNPIFKPQNIKSKLKSNNLLYVGRLSLEKGVYQLISAFQIFLKKNKKLQLKLVGSGGQKKI